MRCLARYPRSLALLGLAILLLACARAPAAPASAPVPTAAPAASAGGAPAGGAPVASAPTAAPAAAPAAPTTVKVGVIGSPSDAGLYVALERGYFTQQGIEAEFTYFDSGARIPPAIGVEQLQVGAGAPSAAFFNLVAQEVPLKLVADKGVIAENYGFEGLMVRKDLLDSGQVRTVADLRGRTVAYVTEANSTHFLLDLTMRLGGLSDRDVNTVAMPFPDMVPALANRNIEAAMYLEPNGARAEDLGVGVRWITGHQAFPNFQLGYLFYSAGFTKQEALARRFLLAYIQGVREYNNAFERSQNKDSVIAAVAKHATVKDPAVYQRMWPAKLHPDGELNLESYREEYAWYLDRGYIKNRIDPMSIVDDSFRQWAVAQLGPYR
jgi:NitT/TauT family transport system substrate-binding protein